MSQPARDDGPAPTGGRRRVLLLRHGRTAWNAGGRFQGHTDIDLDDAGRLQAGVAGPVVAALRPSVVLSSDLRRAAETAAPVAAAAGLPLRLDARLREIDVGAWAGLTAAEVGERFPAELALWQAGRDVQRTGGESNHDVAVRSSAALHDALADLPEGGLLVAVSHGGTIRAAATALVGLPEEHRGVLGALGNTRWALLTEQRGPRWRITEWNAGPGPA